MQNKYKKTDNRYQGDMIISPFTFGEKRKIKKPYIDTIPLKWTIEIHKVFNYSRRWDFLCPEKANTHLNKRNGQLSSI